MCPLGQEGSHTGVTHAVSVVVRVSRTVLATGQPLGTDRRVTGTGKIVRVDVDVTIDCHAVQGQGPVPGDNGTADLGATVDIDVGTRRCHHVAVDRTLVCHGDVVCCGGGGDVSGYRRVVDIDIAVGVDTADEHGVGIEVERDTVYTAVEVDTIGDVTLQHDPVTEIQVLLVVYFGLCPGAVVVDTRDGGVPENGVDTERPERVALLLAVPH